MANFTKKQLDLLFNFVEEAIEVKKTHLPGLSFFKFAEKKTIKENINYLSELIEEIKRAYEWKEEGYEFSTGTTRVLSHMALMYYQATAKKLHKDPKLRADLESIIEKSFDGEYEKLNGKIINIIDPAYVRGNKIIVKTEKFHGTADTWEYLYEFSDQNKAKKFIQELADKGNINTRNWKEFEDQNDYESDNKDITSQTKDQDIGEEYFNQGLKYDMENSDVRAAEYYRKACDAGYVSGCFNLGLMYEEGQGVTQNDIKAVEFYRKACDGNNAKGCFNLGVMYANGQGIEEDSAKAKEFFRKACDEGHERACIHYKIMNENDQNIEHKNSSTDNWMQRLWDWADENNISEDVEQISTGYIGGIPRNKEQLFALIELDISWKELSIIPKEIGNLTQLNILNIAGNKEAKLPDELWKLTNLRELNLEYTNLNELPKEIGNFSNLEILHINNTFVNQLPSEIGKLKNLRELFVFNEGNVILPSELWQLTNLTKLSIRTDFEDGVPAEIGNLTKLTFLGLMNCNIESLPSEIGNLINLDMLVLYENNLEYLPEEIGKLKKLTYLGLNDNLLSMLPNTIGNLTNLETLKLQNNTLIEIPDEICSLKSLINLDIRDNFNIALPSCFEVLLDNSKGFLFETNDEDEVKIYSDSSLGISDEAEDWMQELWSWSDRNDIPNLEWIEDEEYEKGGFWRGMPRDKRELLEMTELILDEIQFSKLPKEIGKLSNLTTLSLRESKITELPKEIGNLDNLTLLSLWGNQLTSLPKEIGSLSNLTTLILGENKLSELPKEIGYLSNLLSLLIWDNQLTTLPKEIENLSNLTRLDLEGNQLAHLQKEIGDLTNLSELILKRNLLSEIPKEIGNLINLKELQLENNKLKTLPSEIKYLNSLKILVLENNILSELPKEIGETKNLEELFSENNLLTKLPDEIVNLDSLEHISLKENALILTDKQKEWFYDILMTNRAFVSMDAEPLRAIYAYGDHQNEEPLSMESLIQQKGLEYIAQGISELVDSKIHTKEVALQFVLEELDAARSGNQKAYDFVQNSGFKPSEYINAMNNSFDKVDGSNGPQMTLHTVAMMEISDIDLKVELTLGVVDKIMKIYSLGKYSESN